MWLGAVLHLVQLHAGVEFKVALLDVRLGLVFLPSFLLKMTKFFNNNILPRFSFQPQLTYLTQSSFQILTKLGQIRINPTRDFCRTLLGGR